jgi:hypothetical protein
MPLADSSYSYPLLDIFWTMFEIFLFVTWIWLLIWIFTDIFRSSDLSGWAKGLWLVFVLVIPVIGILSYLIIRGSTMHERTAREARQRDEAFRAYVRDAAGTTGSASPASSANPATPATTADQLTKLAKLRDQGDISDDEFQREKAKVLAAAPERPVPDPRAGQRSSTTSS